MKRAAVAISLLGLTLLAGNALAFCRETSCDPKLEACPRDAETTCETAGTPLAWPSGCVDLYVQADGAASQGIGFDAAKQSLQRAVDTWLHVDCGGAAPSIQVNVLGPITCHTAEYNEVGENANIVMFRESDWNHPNAADSIGFTQVSFGDSDDGQIRDGDIELNAFEFQFSVGDPATASDLDSVLTHEVGHWLGLDHTTDPSATMYPKYVSGTTGLRTLAPDDEQGICAAYPPARMLASTSCEPRHGFSDVCLAAQPPMMDSMPDPGSNGGACALRPGSPREGGWAPALLLLGLVVRRRNAARGGLDAQARGRS